MDRAVNIATRLGAGRSGGSYPDRGDRFSPKRRNPLWGPHILLFSGYWEALSPTTQSGRSARMHTHLHLAPMLRMSGSIPPFPIYAFMACTKKFLLWSGTTSNVITFDLWFAHGCDVFKWARRSKQSPIELFSY